MNDRFKFRTWHKPTKTMEYNKLWTSKNWDKRLHDNNFVLMQSTGLKDKNGKLIYEGDIVTDVLANKFIVNFSIEYSSFLLTNIKTKESMVFYPKVKLEVIGNQFENPELLEEQCANQLNKE